MAGSLIQSAFSDASAASVGLAFPANNTAGSALICFAAYGSGSGNTMSVSDSRNGSYGSALITVNDGVDNNTFAIFAKTNCAAGSNTVTMTPSGGAANIGICIVE